MTTPNTMYQCYYWFVLTCCRTQLPLICICTNVTVWIQSTFQRNNNSLQETPYHHHFNDNTTPLLTSLRPWLAQSRSAAPFTYHDLIVVWPSLLSDLMGALGGIFESALPQAAAQGAAGHLTQLHMFNPLSIFEAIQCIFCVFASAKLLNYHLNWFVQVFLFSQLTAVGHMISHLVSCSKFWPRCHCVRESLTHVLQDVCWFTWMCSTERKNEVVQSSASVCGGVRVI